MSHSESSFFQHMDGGERPVEHRHRTLSFFQVAVNVGHLRVQKTLGVCPYLVGGAVVNLQSLGTSANLNTQFLP